MATKIFTPSMLRGAGTRGVPEIPASSGFSNTYSFAFDGVDEVIDLGASSTVGNTGVWSLSFWVKGASQGHYVNLFAAAYYNNWTFYEAKDANLMFRNINGVQFTLMTDVFDDNWHHIVVLRNPSGADKTLRTYKDGANETNITLDWRYRATGGLYNGALRYIGGHATGGGIVGLMDEISVWDSELSTADIATIYNSGTPGDLTSLSPIAWYRMGEEASWDGTDWTLTDQGSSGTDAVSDNMEEADRSSTVP